MGNTAISALPAATSISSADTLVIVQGGVTKRATASLIPSPGATTAAVVQADGTDLASLNEAFAAAAALGLPCVLPAGTYNAGGGRLTLPTGLTLRGAGIGQTIIASNVLLSGRLNVSDLTIGVAGQYTSIADGATDSSLTRVKFSKGASQANIYVQNVATARFTFELCEISDNANGGDGVCLVDKGTVADHIEDFLFLRCRFYNNDRMNLEILQRNDQGAVVLGYRSINCEWCYFGAPVGAHGADSTNNVSYDSMELTADANTPSSGYSTFTHNIVVGGHYALEIAEAIRMTITENTIIGGDARILSCSGQEHMDSRHTISKNRFIGTIAANEVVVMGSGNTFSENHSNTPGSVHFLQSDRSIANANIIETTGPVAFDLDQSKDCKVYGNRFVGGTDQCFWLHGGGGNADGNAVYMNDMVLVAGGADVYTSGTVNGTSWAMNRQKSTAGVWSAGSRDS